jgi:hypothetical protein
MQLPKTKEVRVVMLEGDMTEKTVHIPTGFRYKEAVPLSVSTANAGTSRFGRIAIILEEI